MTTSSTFVVASFLAIIISFKWCGWSGNNDKNMLMLVVSAAAPIIKDAAIPLHDGFNLEGTLYWPTGTTNINDRQNDTRTIMEATAAGTPKVGIVLVHGSGPQSRNETISGQLGISNFGFTIPVFYELAMSLSSSSSGMAVLTYDKRSCGLLNNCSNNSYPIANLTNVTVRDFIQDAAAAATYLQGFVQDVLVLGHSQGGEFIPILLDSNPTLAGGIIVAGPFHPIQRLLAYQYNFTLALLERFSGWNETTAWTMVPEVASFFEANQRLQQLAQTGSPNASLLDNNGNETDTIMGASTTFWQSWIDTNTETKAAAARLGGDRPLLVLSGELDTQVPPSEARAWGDYLESVGVVHEVVVLPCVSHALNCLQQEDLALLAADDIGTTVDPSVSDAIVEFVEEYIVVGVEKDEEEEKPANGSGDNSTNDHDAATSSANRFRAFGTEHFAWLLVPAIAAVLFSSFNDGELKQQHFKWWSIGSKG